MSQNKSSMGSRSGMPAFGTFGGQGQASLRLEKSNPGLRRSTPDSDALASSDDELENKSGSLTNKATRPARRTSWLNEIPQNRKPSMTASGPYSPSISHPTTPGVEATTWTAMTSPAAAWNNPNTSYPWGGIWSQESSRKEPPARLSEVPQTDAAGIPFSIPLKPTPKTYRSQSYSVGQLDDVPGPISTAPDATRSRLGHQYPSQQRRASRPAGLGERNGESGGLGQVAEVDDDDDTARHQAGQDAALNQARMIQRLERENAQLRQAAQTRDRTLSTPSTSMSAAGPTSFMNSRISGAVTEEAELAVDDNEILDSMANLHGRQMPGRRLSENIGLHYDRQPVPGIENRPLDSRKAHWQTSLGFGRLEEIPQSRRHSFADVPTRHNSFSSDGKTLDQSITLARYVDSKEREDTPVYNDRSQELSHRDNRELALTTSQFIENEMKNEYLLYRRAAATYFHVSESSRRAAESTIRQAYTAPNPYGQHSSIGAYHGPATQPLFIVNFKCSRSDVYYIQEGTGLHVAPGDLVIVEADRGTDLGTVQHTNITWDEARRYKEYYAEEHYKWLMMFSQQSRNGGPNVVNPNGLSGGRQGSAVGGMGPSGHHGPHEAPYAELKPKMIKRLAQNHEIQALKDKEGNEAKAKRVCQQKVIEHRLNMEILDAEFQMYVLSCYSRAPLTPV